ncbi:MULTISPECIES: endonuclease/exonuclease/phosphatase family protein [unclassified Nocardioides]|uniref:endonuclease/exonuclease/phosphatase family protein n=1 Tax=unclassified Nocardioides TaxID=2615069 RepID=UPI0006F1ED2B|nr:MULTISPECIES: endonuclease/exonuclease/phosphatase family protein [unclassified Nocardioides]KQY56563.1 hypothetical protein ASD30_09540 [Nocardioides sp. Root140]KRF14397.1 hypothetical protein ASH02_08645 [Nocardioides sp. Soil796]
MPIIRVAVAGALAVLLTVPALFSALFSSEAARGHAELGHPVTVMTRNLFLGTDVFPIFAAAQAAGSPRARIDATARAMHEVRSLVATTRFRTRARLIAAEIARHDPDLVGLQEVALWRSGPREPDLVGVPNAVSVDLDFLRILMAELDSLDHDYLVVSSLGELDLEFPGYRTRSEPGRDVRLTLRDVVLVRVRDGLTVVDRGREHFTSRVRMRLPGRLVDFTRGHTWVDVENAGQRVRFINTHLEVGDPRVGRNQVRELLDGPAASRGPVVVVCDCNSDPMAGRRSMPYRGLTGAGFVDTWLTVPSGGPGHTCCTASNLLDDGPGVMDHRLDFVFARSRRGVVADRGTVLGATGAARDEVTGLWPSDHAGVVVRLVDR